MYSDAAAGIRGAWTDVGGGTSLWPHQRSVLMGGKVFVAGLQRYTVGSAAAAIRDYADSHSATIKHYDLGGPDEVDIVDSVSSEDIGRMVFINARLSGADAAHLTSADLMVKLHPLGIDLRVEDVELDPRANDPRYLAMLDAWSTLQALPKIGAAKASKLLHLKRPKLFPLIDSYVKRVYKSSALAAGIALGSTSPHYWLPLAADTKANAPDFATVRDELSEDASTRHLIYLSDLRFQDILAWRLAE